MREPHNISLYPGTGTADGRRGDHILLAPSYTVRETEIIFIADTTLAVVQEFFNARS